MLKSIFNYNKLFSFRSFNPSNPRSNFSVTTAPRVTPESELFYKRDLPPHLIPFSSPEGKQLFQEAMKQGNMEAYFTLAEHLITQAEPSTCGPTSLSMIVNTLHIDPDRHWKGIWRWSSEYNLYCCPEDYLKKGLSLEQFANLAHCNRTKVQAFYHQSDKNEENTESIPLVIEGEDSGKVIHSKIEFNHEGVCLNKHGLMLKQSSYTTFLNNLVASSRRTGLYMIMNFSRAHLGQTGEGHFNPIAGVHLNGKKAKALILDLAKFKYPGYWVDLEPLYDSMRPVDPSTGKSRGYMMISSNKVVNPTSRGISEDPKSKKECTRHIKTIPKKIEAFIASYLEKNNNRPTEQEVLYSIFINLGRDCNYLLTYYLYDLSVRLESKQEKEIGLRKELFGFDNTKLCSIIKSTLVSKHKNINNHQLFWIVYDYQPALMANILTCLLYALQRFIVSNTEIRLEEFFEDRISLSEPLQQEIAKIQKIFGIEE